VAGEHILVVDDEPAIQSALRGVLEDEGYRVTTAGSGEAALRLVVEDAPDVVFLDIWMPKKDGLDTLADLKRVRPEAPVIVISGHGTIETAVKATRLGAYDFIEKPLSLEKTLVTVTRALEHTRPSARTWPCGRAWTCAPRSSGRATWSARCASRSPRRRRRAAAC
jgi:two-component system nitrogen regulation response regulator NtrX